MQNFIRLVYLMRILLHVSTYFPNTPRTKQNTLFFIIIELISIYIWYRKYMNV